MMFLAEHVSPNDHAPVPVNGFKARSRVLDNTLGGDLTRSPQFLELFASEMDLEVSHGGILDPDPVC